MGWSPDIGQEIQSSGGFLIPHPAVVDPEETFPGAVTGASDCFKSSAVWVVGDGTKEAFRGRAAGVSDYFTSQSELEAGIGTKPP